METIALIFILTKLVDFARIFNRVNVIVLTLNQSVGLLLTFMLLLIIFNIALLPLAQAIWGTYLIGYKTSGDAIVSVFMIAYSKGDLEILLDINFIWSTVFMLMYYFMGIFVLHAAFHNTQTDALKNIVLLYSLEETDVIEDDGANKRGKDEEMTPKEIKKQQLEN